MATSKLTTLNEIIEATITSRLADLYYCLPGIVVAYYSTTMEADVQISINDPRFEPDTDVLTTEPWPVWPRMRVVWPKLGGGWTPTGPLAAGDKVQVFFQDLDDSGYRQTGQQGDPLMTRRHGSDSAWCVPLDVTDKGVPTGTVDALALASKIDLFIQTVMGWTPVANDGGAALKAALQAASPPFTTSTTVDGPPVQHS